MLHAGTQTINGHVVVVNVDSNGYVVSVVFPYVTDTFGNPLTITFSPMLLPGDISDAVDAIISRLPPAP